MNRISLSEKSIGRIAVIRIGTGDEIVTCFPQTKIECRDKAHPTRPNDSKSGVGSADASKQRGRRILTAIVNHDNFILSAQPVEDIQECLTNRQLTIADG